MYILSNGEEVCFEDEEKAESVLMRIHQLRSEGCTAYETIKVITSEHKYTQNQAMALLKESERRKCSKP